MRTTQIHTQTHTDTDTDTDTETHTHAQTHAHTHDAKCARLPSTLTWVVLHAHPAKDILRTHAPRPRGLLAGHIIVPAEEQKKKGGGWLWWR